MSSGTMQNHVLLNAESFGKQVARDAFGWPFGMHEADLVSLSRAPGTMSMEGRRRSPSLC